MLLEDKNAIVYGVGGASDRASAMTAAIANVTCGAFIDL